MPIIFCAQIFTWHKTRQLSIKAGNWHFTRHKFRQSVFLPGN